MSNAEGIISASSPKDITSLVRILIIIIAVMAATPVMVLPLIVGAMIDTLGISAKQAGFIVAAELFGSGLAAFLLSMKVHAWNRHKIIYMALLLVIIANVSSIFVVEWQFLFVVRFLAGAGAAATVATVKAALANTRNPDRSFGLYVFVGLLIGVVAMPGFSYIVSDWGLNGAYILFATIGGGAMCMVSIFPHFRGKKNGSLGGTVQINYKLAAIALLAILVFYIGQGAIWTYVERIGVASNIESRKVGFILGLSYAVGGLGALLAIFMGSRYGRKIPTISGIIVIFLSVYLLLGSSSYVVYVIATCGFSLAAYFTLPYLFGLLSILDKSGRIVAMGLAVQATGMALGPAIAGMTVKGSDYSNVKVMAMGCFVLSLIIIVPCLFRIKHMNQE